MAKPDRIIKLEVSVSANLSALRRRVLARLRKIRRAINFGPPFHTFAQVDVMLRGVPEDKKDDFKKPRCLWCDREERWWRMYEKCNFYINPGNRPFRGTDALPVEFTDQVPEEERHDHGFHSLRGRP